MERRKLTVPVIIIVHTCSLLQSNWCKTLMQTLKDGWIDGSINRQMDEGIEILLINLIRMGYD